jgi:hypothetical protein
MAIKDTDRKARANYKKKVVTVRVELYGTDEDIREHVEKLKEAGESVQGYIKDLIRADLMTRDYGSRMEEERRKDLPRVSEEKRQELIDQFDAGVKPSDIFKVTHEK